MDLTCHCSSARCRGLVTGDDAEAIAGRLDQAILHAAAAAATVAQPLWGALRPADRAWLEGILTGRHRVPSCLETLEPRQAAGARPPPRPSAAGLWSVER